MEAVNFENLGKLEEGTPFTENKQLQVDILLLIVEGGIRFGKPQTSE